MAKKQTGKLAPINEHFSVQLTCAMGGPIQEVFLNYNKKTEFREQEETLYLKPEHIPHLKAKVDELHAMYLKSFE